MNYLYSRHFKLNTRPSVLHFSITPNRYHLELTSDGSMVAWCKSTASLDECVSYFLQYVRESLTGDYLHNVDDYQEVKKYLNKIIIEHRNK